MITPAVSLNSIQPRNPVQELTLTSTRSESSSDLTQVERPSQSVILPAQVVSVTTLSEEVAPTDENEAAVSDRALGAQDSSFSKSDPAEAAQIRRTAEIPLIEPESPSRFRRLFATAVGYRTEIRRDPVAHGR